MPQLAQLAQLVQRLRNFEPGAGAPEWRKVVYPPDAGDQSPAAQVQRELLDQAAYYVRIASALLSGAAHQPPPVRNFDSEVRARLEGTLGHSVEYQEWASYAMTVEALAEAVHSAA